MKQLIFSILILFSLTATAQQQRYTTKIVEFKPATPPATIANKGQVFYRSSDNRLCVKNSNGTVQCMGDTVAGGGLWTLDVNNITQADTTHRVYVDDSFAVQSATHYLLSEPGLNEMVVNTATDTTLITQTDTLIETIVIRADGSLSSMHHSGDHLEINVRDEADSTSSILHIHGNEGFVFEKDKITGTDSIMFQVKTDTRQIQYFKDPCAGCILADDGAGLGLLEYVTDKTGDGVFTIDAANNMYAGTNALNNLTIGSENFVVGLSAGTAITSGTNNVLLGNEANLADSTYTISVAVGYQATVGQAGVSIGSLANASGDQGIAIGSTATATGTESVAFGSNAQATQTYSSAFGSGALATHKYSTSLGYSATSTDSNQIVMGSAVAPLNALYIGEGVVSATPQSITINATGGSGTNIAGSTLTNAAGKGTGNAIGGDYVERTSVPGASGTTLQTLGDRQRVLAKYTTLTETTATSFARVNIPSSTVAGGEIIVTVQADDATDFQTRTLTFAWAAENKAGTSVVGLSTPVEAVAVSAGTLTCTITATDAGSGNIDFKADCTSSLTQTTLRANAQVFKNFGTGAVSAQ